MHKLISINKIQMKKVRPLGGYESEHEKSTDSQSTTSTMLLPTKLKAAEKGTPKLIPNKSLPPTKREMRSTSQSDLK